MDVFHLEEEAKRLRRTEGEVGHRKLVERPGYRAGLVLFRRPNARPEKPGEITHPDLDVVAHVIGGSGTLTVKGESRDLVPGMVLHLPAGTPHDFAAGHEDLLLFYALIQSKTE
ncbi:MAG: cupin domain-containing protein [Nitrospinota bacterium]